MLKSQLLTFGLVGYLFSGLSLPAQAAQSAWQINPDSSSLTFHLKNMGMPVDGKFTKLSGKVNYDDKDLADSTVEANVDTGSINTGIGMRDHHLKSKDFFNIAKFPQAEFRSSKIVVSPSGDFQIFGTLSLHGVSQEITLNSKPLNKNVDQSGKNHLIASASTNLRRKTFAIGGWSAASVGDDVTIDLAIDLIKP
jgi:polyisoprenoid-binding protein YceI